MPPGQDVMISVYNIHHSPAVWDDPEAFRPERFPLDEPVPTEANTDYRHAALDFLLTTFAGGTLHNSLLCMPATPQAAMPGCSTLTQSCQSMTNRCAELQHVGVGSALQHSGASS